MLQLPDINIMLKEFKEFALKGNVLDLAVGVIIGAAFGKIVTSLVEDIIMPPLGFLLGKVAFANLFLNLSGKPVASLDAARKAGLPVIAYGQFLLNVLNFLIVAFAVFLVIKQVNRIRRGALAATPEHSDCPHCRTSILSAATRCPNCTTPLEGFEGTV